MVCRTNPQNLTKELPSALHEDDGGGGSGNSDRVGAATRVNQGSLCRAIQVEWLDSLVKPACRFPLLNHGTESSQPAGAGR